MEMLTYNRIAELLHHSNCWKTIKYAITVAFSKVWWAN